MNAAKNKSIGFLEAARNLEKLRQDASQITASAEDREYLKHRSGKPLADAAIKAIAFLAPFEYEVVEAQESKVGKAPDWVVIRDSVTEVTLRIDLLDDVLIRPELNTRYPAAGSGYKLSIVLPRSGWYLKSAFNKYVGSHWKIVGPASIESFQELEQAVTERQRIIDSRLRDANG